MSAYTKTRHTSRSRIIRAPRSEKNISWREAAKKDIRKHSEGGQMLRACRFKVDMSQAKLAEKLKVSQHHISEMENGKRPIGKEIANRLAVVFKTDYRLFL